MVSVVCNRKGLGMPCLEDTRLNQFVGELAVLGELTVLREWTVPGRVDCPWRVDCPRRVDCC